MSQVSFNNNTVRWVVGTAVAAGVLGWHARQFLPFMADDAFISLRYSDRLIHGQGLTWSDGPRVEGYTNLLWVLGCALLGLVMDLVLAARLLAFASASAVLAAVVFVGRSSWAGWFVATAIAVGLALSGPMGVWAMGGLEQPLLCAGLAWTVVGLLDSTPRRWVAISAVVAVLSRADAISIVGLIFGLRLLVEPRAWRALLRVAVWPVGALTLQLAFRRLYYREWVPNTARLKASFSMNRLEEGWHYVMDGWRVWSALLVVAVLVSVVMLAFKLQRRFIVLGLVPSLAWAAYVSAIGGDIFPARRHLLVIVVLLSLHVVVGLVLVAKKSRAAAAVLAVGLCLAQLHWAKTDPRSLDAKHERWEWDAATTGPFFARVFGAKDALMAIDAAGSLGYFSRLPAIDMLGLNDFEIARRLPAGWGKGSLSFDLHNVGAPDSVLSRRPTLIIPCTTIGHDGPCAFIPSSARLFAHPDFATNYMRVAYRAEGLGVFNSVVYVRRDSAAAIEKTSKGTILKPPSLAHDGAVLKELGHRVVVEVPPGAAVSLGNQALGCPWRVDGDQRLQLEQTQNGPLWLKNPTTAVLHAAGVACALTP